LLGSLKTKLFVFRNSAATIASRAPCSTEANCCLGVDVKLFSSSLTLLNDDLKCLSKESEGEG
jgi:hypothetical protein